MGCLFCNIVEKKIPAAIVHEDEHTLAFRDINPVAPTHVLVIPKKHVAAMHDTTPADAELLGRLFTAANGVARELGLVDKGYRLVVNDGADGGQSVFHVHVHVLGGRSLAWPPG